MYTLAYIAQFEPWLDGRFWAACVKGSDKATEIVDMASIFAAMTRGGEEIFEKADAQDFDAALASCVPPASQFPTAQVLLDALYEKRMIGARIWARPTPIAPRDAYSALWKAGKEVPVSQLAHDAALFAVAHWNGETLVRLADTIGEDGLEYNSLDAASAMLLMWTTLQEHKRTPKKA